MKNLYFSFLMAILAAFPLGAQAGYDLDFSHWAILDSNGDTVQTVVTGNNYSLSGTIINNSDQDFEGYIDFNLAFIEDPKNYDWPGRDKEVSEMVLKFLDGNNERILLNIPGYSRLRFNLDLFIDEKIFDDTSGIVITWPTISYSDEGESNNYGIFKIDVANKTSAGLNNINQNLNFDFYPNPAKNYINIVAGNWQNATLTLSDMQGRLLDTWTFRNLNGDRLTINLKNKTGMLLPAGIYNLQLQTPDGQSNRRLMIGE